jgi:hypothetical protein
LDRARITLGDARLKQDISLHRFLVDTWSRDPEKYTPLQAMRVAAGIMHLENSSALYAFLAQVSS